jgi:phage tail P2-like protein
MAAPVSSLLPPNATVAERALEGATARIGDVATPLRDLWSPDTCPVDLLPWLAWALSIDSWQSYWPEHIKRARIRAALNIQRRKGTVQSVREVIEAFGGAVALREWWQYEPPGIPHTFDLTLTLSGEGGAIPSARFIDDVIDEVERTKPVRSHFTFTQGLSATASVGIAAAARAVVYRRLQFDGLES